MRHAAVAGLFALILLPLPAAAALPNTVRFTDPAGDIRGVQQASPADILELVFATGDNTFAFELAVALPQIPSLEVYVVNFTINGTWHTVDLHLGGGSARGSHWEEGKDTEVAWGFVRDADRRYISWRMAFPIDLERPNTNSDPFTLTNISAWSRSGFVTVAGNGYAAADDLHVDGAHLLAPPWEITPERVLPIPLLALGALLLAARLRPR